MLRLCKGIRQSDTKILNFEFNHLKWFSNLKEDELTMVFNIFNLLFEYHLHLNCLHCLNKKNKWYIPLKV